eukprot:TRINITY_DN11129_c0_g1_i1.p1 TRINITY_DN11129_c0_g1~~TRINITY_DN11129_c0_g1_i1.p1  ORF type:complete len:459 (+),score=121.35 TRINITY_DN11129_c0_g1_i1:68-1444(+)
MTDPEWLTTGAKIGIAFGVIGFVICHIPICYGFFILVRRVYRRIRYGKKPQDIEKADSVNDARTTVEVDMHTLIPKLKNVEIQKKISEGTFGEVYKGGWNDTKVALKKLRGSAIEDFKQEAATLFKLVHPNCVQFLGIFEAPDKENYLVMEYLPQGNALNLLRKSTNLTALDLFQLTISAARGMAYLEEQKVVHSDLACRNLLVTSVDGQYQSKVSDFGLSLAQANVDVNSTAKLQQKLPVRWAAVELMSEGAESSIKTDVWSFGVVMWEIFSYGQVPYGETPTKELIRKIPAGERLSAPAGCPTSVFSIMQSCWAMDPNQRPTFSKITKDLKSAFKNFKADHPDIQPIPHEIREYTEATDYYQSVGDADERPAKSDYYQNSSLNLVQKPSSEYHTTSTDGDYNTVDAPTKLDVEKAQSDSSSDDSSSSSSSSDDEDPSQEEKRKNIPTSIYADVLPK